MKKTFSSKKSAFSLIELSIVLIIIGLLIAGITGGASLIKSSELRSVMSEAKSYQVAVNSFYTQYDSYPGDTDISVGNNSTFAGNRNNQIQYAIANGLLNGVAAAGFEGIDAWQDLRDIGAIDLNLTFGSGSAISLATAAATTFTPITNIPGSKIKGGGWAFDYNISSLQNVVVLTGKTKTVTPGAISASTTLVNNHFRTAGTSNSSALACASTPTATNTDPYCTASGPNFPGGLAPYNTPVNNAAFEVLSAPDAYSIDSKVDDGKANSGTVLAVNTKADAVANNCSGSEATSYSTNPGTTTVGSYDKYQTPNGNKKVCALSFSVNI
jgi:prepilin-type N-terminal cleavage/methylation domain-containing protein